MQLKKKRGKKRFQLEMGVGDPRTFLTHEH